MFEKDAKKWVKENTRIEHSASFGEIKVEPSAEKGFSKGAEFGYNKANEELKQAKKQIEKVKYTLKKIIETVQNDRIDEYGERLVLIKDFAYECLQEIDK